MRPKKTQPELLLTLALAATLAALDLRAESGCAISRTLAVDTRALSTPSVAVSGRVTNAPGVVGFEQVVTNATSGTNEFFRLKRP